MRLTGQVIKHHRMMDVAFEVLYCLELPHKYVLKGQWLNMGYVATFMIQGQKRLEIPKADISNYSYCLDKWAKCIRYVDWKPIKD